VFHVIGASKLHADAVLTPAEWNFQGAGRFFARESFKPKGVGGVAAAGGSVL